MPLPVTEVGFVKDIFSSVAELKKLIVDFLIRFHPDRANSVLGSLGLPTPLTTDSIIGLPITKKPDSKTLEAPTSPLT